MTSGVDPTLGGSLTGTGEVSTNSMFDQLTTIASEITALQNTLSATRFTALSDVPNTYLTFGKQAVRVNAGETALEFAHPTGHQDPGKDPVGDADKTLVVGTAKMVQNWATTLTATRTCTLPTANVYTGLRYHIWRSADGAAFALTVVGLGSGGSSTFDLYQDEILQVEYTGTQWDIVSNARSGRALDLRDNLLKNALIEAYTEVETPVSPSSNVVTIDCSASQVFPLTLSASVTSFDFTNVDEAAHTSIFVYFIQDVSGGRTVTWAATVNGVSATILWPGGAAPTVTSDANAVDVFQFLIRSADLTKIYAMGAQAFS